MKYTVLLFDIDNTLLDFDRGERDAMKETLLHAGFRADEQVLSAYSEINNSHWKMLEAGEMDRETILWHRFSVLAEKFGFDGMDPRAFSHCYAEALAKQRQLMPGALEVCTRLSERYPLYVATNGNAAVQKSRFGQTPLAPLFRGCFISEEIGYDKPSPGFFAFVRDAIPGLLPEKTLVIGDSLTSDIAGGIRFGADTCWYCHGDRINRDAPRRDISPTYTIEHLEELTDILLP